MPDYIARSQDAIENYREQLDTIRADTTLSNNGRRAKIASAYDAAREIVDHSKEKHEWTKQAQRQKLERKVFGPPTTTLTGADAISWRDAQDRAAKLLPASYSEPVDNDVLQGEALGLLNRALQSGDDHLARAIVTVAFDMRWADVADAYAQASPDTDTVVELWDAATDEGRGIDLEEFNFILDQPKELNLPPEPEPVNYAANAMKQQQLGRDFADALTEGMADLTTNPSRPSAGFGIPGGTGPFTS
ncbi:hypothetical protein CH260_10345 [Rhodococcus sp. 05-2256-B2]|uniref:hypothetical protein n=1 Tax=unclassified Rhodococcus (in: high G+C Gram-positive bacteria) TaxID=192944 RepID=UPI000B9A38E6|nr:MULTISPECIES: hypothetical protein [unclassified Rhodococcus (in: high G+C Gram-positive bacteria)]OZD81824.1 hypothetical protein CH258_19835 [Rhodococcus sp. 05-2256-B4]OZD90445.1 hypothetical protein CH257_18230 [Rhodococcus sp. 05-2256-B3]OZD96931.1 hypothetical protein CH260_10345 [Rhodococcus sp. 05-2256-B2]OZE00447.1 hypothetical protein CH285_19480 [Rhodococcus sp. 05-2256-B1]